MTCPKCQRHVFAIYRMNRPGELPAQWACKACMGAQPIDPEVSEIVDILTESEKANGN
jgi:hypothetical protein